MPCRILSSLCGTVPSDKPSPDQLASRRRAAPRTVLCQSTRQRLPPPAETSPDDVPRQAEPSPVTTVRQSFPEQDLPCPGDKPIPNYSFRFDATSLRFAIPVAAVRCDESSPDDPQRYRATTLVSTFPADAHRDVATPLRFPFRVYPARQVTSSLHSSVPVCATRRLFAFRVETLRLASPRPVRLTSSPSDITSRPGTSPSFPSRPASARHSHPARNKPVRQDPSTQCIPLPLHGDWPSSSKTRRSRATSRVQFQATHCDKSQPGNACRAFPTR